MSIRSTAMVAALALSTIPVSAQGPGNSPSEARPPRGLLPNGTFSLAGSDQINVVSRKATYVLPITSLPPGRSGTGFDLGLTYNSQGFNVRSSLVDDGEGPPDLLEKTELFPTPMWRYSFQYGLELEEKDLPPGGFDCSNTNEAYEVHGFRMWLRMPDGSAKHLHLRVPDNQNNYSGVSEDNGYARYSPTGQGFGCDVAVQLALNYPKTFIYYTSDGSHIKVEIDADPTVPWTQQEWRAYFPNGSYIRGFNDLTHHLIVDSNSQVYDIEYFTVGSLDEVVIRESWPSGWTGREIEIDLPTPAPGSPIEQIIKKKGFGGTTDVVWKTKWRINATPFTYVCIDGWQGTAGAENCGFQGFNVLDEIELPQQLNPGSAFPLKQVFEYNGPFGELSRIIFPSTDPTDLTKSAYTDYTFTSFSGGPPTANDALTEAGKVNQKKLSYQQSGSTRTDTWDYTFPGTGCTSGNGRTCVKNPDGGVSEYVHHTSEVGNSSPEAGPEGLVYQIDMPSGDRIKRVWAQNLPYDGLQTHNPKILEASDPGNPFVQKEIRSIANSSGSLIRSAVTEFEYDKNGNLLNREECDWTTVGSQTCTSPLRSVVNTYYVETPGSQQPIADHEQAYWREHSSLFGFIRHVRNLSSVKRTELLDGASTIRAVSEFAYDDPYIAANLTSEKHWDSSRQSTPPGPGALNVATNAIETTRTYVQGGAMTQETSPDGAVTKFTYGAIGGLTDLYPTQIERAFNTTIERTETNSYDFTTGLVTNRTDVDNSVSTVFGYDLLGRQTSVTEAGLRKTTTDYDAVNRIVLTKSDLDTFEDGKLQNATHYDQLGRVALTRQSELVALGATSTTDGIRTSSKYLTEAGRSCQIRSNPYRSTSDPTMGWTRTVFDQDGRVTNVATFSGTTAPSNCTTTTNRTGWTETAYSAALDGRLATVTEKGEGGDKLRDNYTDALGRLTRVTEQAEVSPITLYNTTYGYDALSNLTSVCQKGTGASCPQTRSYAYNSLSRLVCASNPESRTTSTLCGLSTPTSGVERFTYYADGPLWTKKDARNITTTFSYDTLNRQTSKTYSGDGGVTPWVDFAYGSTAPNVGSLTRVHSGGMASNFTYDTLGRTITSSQETAGQTYSFAYTYLLNGTLKTLTNPAGRVLTYTYDGAGRELTAADGTTTFVSSSSSDYSPHGARTALQYGTTTATYEYRDYNSRLQLSEVGLGIFPGGAELIKLTNGYSSLKNNGNVQSQQVQVGASNLTQTYGYDGLNRLVSAVENGNPVWSESYSYDPHGNRALVGAAAPIPSLSTHFNSSNNRITVPGASYGYDNAGNLTVDGSGMVTMSYDAENRMTALTDSGTASNNRTYSYDGEGQRVIKSTTGASPKRTVYVYDAFGRLAAEYSEQTIVGQGVKFRVADSLGSTRAVLDAAGNVVGLNDYTPFGERIGSGPGARTTLWNGDLFQQQFTGQLRDGESELDYFISRYYSPRTGRFASADLALVDQSPVDPQSWNLYGYVRNNPLRFSDPTGKECVDGVDTETGNDCIDVIASFQRIIIVLEPIVVTVGEAFEDFGDFMVQPRDPGCMAAAQVGGLATGAAAGGALGAFGFAGGPPVGAGTTASGALVGGTFGFASGSAVGLNSCMSGGGSGGGGNGSQGAANVGVKLTAGGKRKIGNLAHRKDDTVADVIRSRGGTTTNVNKAGHWAQRPLGEAANAAADGDQSAETAVKIAKQAGTKGQRKFGQ